MSQYTQDYLNYKKLQKCGDERLEEAQDDEFNENERLQIRAAGAAFYRQEVRMRRQHTNDYFGGQGDNGHRQWELKQECQAGRHEGPYLQSLEGRGLDPAEEFDILESRIDKHLRESHDKIRNGYSSIFTSAPVSGQNDEALDVTASGSGPVAGDTKLAGTSKDIKLAATQSAMPSASPSAPSSAIFVPRSIARASKGGTSRAGERTQRPESSPSYAKPNDQPEIRPASFYNPNVAAGNRQHNGLHDRNMHSRGNGAALKRMPTDTLRDSGLGTKEQATASAESQPGVTSERHSAAFARTGGPTPRAPEISRAAPFLATNSIRTGSSSVPTSASAKRPNAVAPDGRTQRHPLNFGQSASGFPNTNTFSMPKRFGPGPAISLPAIARSVPLRGNHPLMGANRLQQLGRANTGQHLSGFPARHHHDPSAHNAHPLNTGVDARSATLLEPLILDATMDHPNHDPNDLTDPDKPSDPAEPIGTDRPSDPFELIDTDDHSRDSVERMEQYGDDLEFVDLKDEDTIPEPFNHDQLGAFASSAADVNPYDENLDDQHIGAIDHHDSSKPGADRNPDDGSSHGGEGTARGDEWDDIAGTEADQDELNHKHEYGGADKHQNEDEFDFGPTLEHEDIGHDGGQLDMDVDGINEERQEQFDDDYAQKGDNPDSGDVDANEDVASLSHEGDPDQGEPDNMAWSDGGDEQSQHDMDDDGVFEDTHTDDDDNNNDNDDNDNAQDLDNTEDHDGLDEDVEDDGDDGDDGQDQQDMEEEETVEEDPVNDDDCDEADDGQDENEMEENADLEEDPANEDDNDQDQYEMEEDEGLDDDPVDDNDNDDDNNNMQDLSGIEEDTAFDDEAANDFDDANDPVDEADANDGFDDDINGDDFNGDDFNNTDFNNDDAGMDDMGGGDFGGYEDAQDTGNGMDMATYDGGSDNGGYGDPY